MSEGVSPVACAASALGRLVDTPSRTTDLVSTPLAASTARESVETPSTPCKNTTGQRKVVSAGTVVMLVTVLEAKVTSVEVV